MGNPAGVPQTPPERAGEVAEPAEYAAAPEDVPEDTSGPYGTLLELVVADHDDRAPPQRIDGVVIGRLVGIGEHGEPLVSFPASPAESAAAKALCAVQPADVGRAVALLFEGGDAEKPVLMGLVHESAAEPAVSAASPLEATRDGERLVFEADKEIVLRCGKAQITLTRAGKILIKGAYLLARSTGVNRIQGGSVQIN
jgi:hypothetical protein